MGDEAGRLAQDGKQKMFVIDLAVAESIGRVGRHDEAVPEIGRAKGLGQFLLVDPLKRIMAHGRTGMVLVLAGAKNRQDFLAGLLDANFAIGEDLGGLVVALAQAAEQQVLGADVFVTQFAASSMANAMTSRVSSRWAILVVLSCLLPGSIALLISERKVSRSMSRLRRTTAATDDPHRQNAQHDMHGRDVIVVKADGFLIRQGHGPPRPLAESLVHVSTPSKWLVVSDWWLVYGTACDPHWPLATRH